jgi:hypothetical protein
MAVSIRYPQATPALRRAAALEDCKAHLGNAYLKVLEDIRAYWKEPSDASRTRLYRGMQFSLAMFVGIEGRYPVGALMRAALHPEPVKRPHLTLVLSGTMRTVDMRPALEEPDDDAIDLDDPEFYLPENSQE